MENYRQTGPHMAARNREVDATKGPGYLWCKERMRKEDTNYESRTGELHEIIVRRKGMLSHSLSSAKVT